MKGFISYARKDKKYSDLLVEGITTHAAGNPIINWDLWSDNQVIIGQDWNQVIQENLHESDFAILLLSANFFASSYIKEHEFANFLKKKKSEGFLIFPILMRDCQYNMVEKIARLQFFAANPKDYDVFTDNSRIMPYERLVEFDRNNQPIENSYRETYHMNLVKALETAISKYNYRAQQKPEYVRQNYGLITEVQQTPLQKILADLTLHSPIIKDLHRVNCDRILVTRKFWSFFEKTRAEHQLYLISGESYHQPDSFAERIVYELEDELSETGSSIYYKRNAIKGVAKHLVSLEREQRAKRDFRLGFSEMISPQQEQQRDFMDVNEFVASGSPTLKYKHIALIFRFNVSEYSNGFGLEEYLTWINETYVKATSGNAIFSIFLVFHLPPSRSDVEKKTFEKTLANFSSNNKNTVLLNQFTHVKAHDLVRWLSSHLSTDTDIVDAEEVVDNIIQYIDNHFSTRLATRYFNQEHESFQMSFVQKVLNTVCEMYQ